MIISLKVCFLLIKTFSSITVLAVLTTIPALLRPCYNIYLNSRVPASNHKLSSLVAGLSQLLLSIGTADTTGGWEGPPGCSLNNRPSHGQTPQGARQPSRPPSPHEYIHAPTECLFEGRGLIPQKVGATIINPG